MLGMINLEKNAQHTAESMPIRPQDILTLVKANVTNHPQDLQTLKALRDNPNSNISYKNFKRINALIVAIEGDFQNCHQLVVSLGKKYNDVSVKKWLLRYIQGGIDRLLNDIHAGGTKGLLEIEFQLVMDILLCFQPDYLANLACYTPALSVCNGLAGRTTWTRELVAHFLGVAPSTVGKFVKRLQIGYFSESEDKREYCYSTDPDFVGKTILIDLFRKNAAALGYDLWSFDEKTCIQAIRREKAMDAGGSMITLDRYEREGLSHLFALLQPSTGQVHAQFSDKKTGEDIKAFIYDFLNTHYPKDGRKLVLLMDNLGAHGALEELKATFPNLIIIFTPTNSSWMNPIEAFFGTLTKGAIQGHSFTSVEHLKNTVLNFISGYNLRAKPINWDFNIKRCLNQRLNTIACLKQAIPDVEHMLELGQNTFSSQAMALCEFAHKAAAVTHAFSYEGNEEVEGVTLIPQDVADTVTARFKDKPHGLDAFHPSAKAQREVAALDEKDNDSFTLSEEVLNAYQSPEAASLLINKLLKLLPNVPYHKKPERKLTQAVVDKAEAMVVKLENDIETKKAQEVKWAKTVEDLKAEQDESDTAKQSLIEASSCLRTIKRQRACLEERLKKAQELFQKLKSRFSKQVTATEEMFDGMMERLVERLKQALSIWRSYLSQYKANHCKSSLTITIEA